MIGHLDSLGSPSWYARFSAQVITDPALRSVVVEDTGDSPSLRRALERLRGCLPDLPGEVVAERSDMMRQLLLMMPAVRERALADGRQTPRPSWNATADGVVDAITGLWLAPSTRYPDERR